MREAIDAAGKVDPSGIMLSRRTCEISYRGVQVLVKVRSVMDETECQLSSHLKHAAVCKKELVPLSFEADLVDANIKPIVATFDDDLLNSVRLARKTMNTALEAFESGGANTILDIVRLKQDQCIQQDKCFLLDCSFLSGMQGAQGTLILKRKMLACFPPKAANTVCLKTVSSRISEVSRCSLMQFVCESTRAHMETIASIVTSICLRTPLVSRAGSVQSSYKKQ